MLFISWSGNSSKEIGAALKEWLKIVFDDDLEIFFSEETQPGKRWSYELANVLKDCQAGIFIYTQSNLNSQWMAFEAGALSKNVDNARVIPLLLGLNLTDLTGPLTLFQARAFNQKGMLDILEVINNNCIDSPKTKEYLQRNIKSTWDYVSEQIKAILEKYAQVEEHKPDVSETLSSIYSLLQNSNVTSPEFSADIKQLMGEVKSSHEATRALFDRIESTLRGSYLFIDGTEPAFATLTAATRRAKKCIRSTRFSPMAIADNHDSYGQSITDRVIGKAPVERYIRIIAANHPSKLKDIDIYLDKFVGKNFDLFLTKKTSSFEMVTIDEEEVLIHFYAKGEVINSTLSIVGPEVTRNFIQVYEQLIDPRYDSDILKIEFKYMKEDDVEVRRREIRHFFADCFDLPS